MAPKRIVYDIRNNRDMYVIPDLILVGYARSQILMHRCLDCKCRFIPSEDDDLFCEDCHSPYKYDNLPEERYSDIKFRGNIVDWEVEIAMTVKRTTRNFKKVLIRDQYICQYCAYNPRYDKEFIPLHVDHIKPHCVGGNNGMKNLVTACAVCNLIAGGKWFDCWLDKKIYILDRRIQKGLDYRKNYDDFKAA